jgi:hypothetical protein
MYIYVYINRHSKGNEKNGEYHKIDISNNNFDSDNSITINPMTLSVKSCNKDKDTLNHQ